MLRFLASLTVSSALVAALMAVLLAGCASTGSSNKATQGAAPETVVLVDHRNNTRMTLISDTWLRENGVPGEDYVARRAAFYSQKLSGDNLMVKIMNDDIAQGVWQLLSQSGFDRYGKPGAAPAAGGEMVQVIEVLRGGQYVHMGISKATPKAEGEAFKTCLFGFMDVYNNLLQLQTVDRMPAFRSSTTSGNPR